MTFSDSQAANLSDAKRQKPLSLITAVSAHFKQNGTLDHILETDIGSGNQNRWTQSSDGSWHSNGVSEARQKLQLQSNGNLTWQDSSGKTVTQKPGDPVEYLRPAKRTGDGGNQPVIVNDVTPKPVDGEPSQPTDLKPSQPTDLKPSQPTDLPTQPTDVKPSQPTDVKPVEPVREKPSESTDLEPSKPTDLKPSKPEVTIIPPLNSVYPRDPKALVQLRSEIVDLLVVTDVPNPQEPITDKVEKPTPEAELRTARDSFTTAAKERGMDVARMTEFMNTFEKRCEDTKKLGNKAPTQEQITKTYSTLTEMLKGPAQPGGLNDIDRTDLVKKTMYNLADPKNIDQALNLCNVTTSEVFTASRFPENYARVLKEVSLTGKFKTTAGKEITLPPEAIARDPEQNKFTTENVGQDATRNRWRNYASKVFQETGVNSVVPFLAPDANYPAFGKPHVSGKSDMSLPQIQAACENINGQKMPYFPSGDAPTAGELLKLKEDGEFPVGVHTIHVQDSSNGIVSGLHVQTIQDVRMRAGELQVLLDDQRGGKEEEGWVSLRDLHRYQQFNNLGSQWYDIPEKYRGKSFDSLTPQEITPAPRPVPQDQPIKPPSDGPSDPNAVSDRTRERTADSTTPGLLESRRSLQEALFEGVDKGLLKSKREDKIKDILDNFEKRSASDRKDGLVAPDEEQIGKVYRTALATLKNNGVMPYEDRHKLVLEGLRNVSDPTGIDQGDHGTCGNACSEKFIAVRRADIYMDALSQVAATGKYTTQDGRVLELPHNDQRQGALGNRNMTWQRGWKPDAESLSWDIYKESGWHPILHNDGKRNYASQIMQNLNLADALESARLGERQAPHVVDSLNFLHVEDFTKRMTGKPITTINQRIQTEGNIMKPLSDELAIQLKQDGRLPAMVWRAYHWQTIHDVRIVPGKDQYGRAMNVVEVYSDNQWGNNRDRGWLTVPGLHQELSESPY
ncbi:MAG: hypothetical protein SGJ27_01450 [Candidatus Melainabacteria bacterium]|nr:hypothetical protein [Candidatus Melainabacteria bacterium]